MIQCWPSVSFFILFLFSLAYTLTFVSPQCGIDHGWFTSKAIGAAMGMAPTREDIFVKLGLTVEPVKAIAALIANLTRVVGAIQALLDKYDLDFPDKV